MSKITYILGGSSITVFLDGNSYTINNSAPTYDMVLEAVRNNDVVALRSAVNIRSKIYDGLLASSKNVRIVGNSIYYGDRELSGLIASRIFEVIRLGLDVSPMVRFIENLMSNPSKRAVDELFGFLDACTLPITEDGHFLAYKRVNGNYTDCHSGTMDNSKGQVLSMPRNLVDEDKHNTCSYGLHFCSYDYLAHFGGERIMVLKINPADVVAIPADYNNSKGRTCKYEVVDELPLNEYRLPKKKISDSYTTEYSGAWADPEWSESWVDSDDTTEVVEDVAVPASTSTGKLSVADVHEIRRMLCNSYNTLASIARKFSVHPRTIGRIRDGEIWNNV